MFVLKDFKAFIIINVIIINGSSSRSRPCQQSSCSRMPTLLAVRHLQLIIHVGSMIFFVSVCSQQPVSHINNLNLRRQEVVNNVVPVLR